MRFFSFLFFLLICTLVSIHMKVLASAPVPEGTYRRNLIKTYTNNTVLPTMLPSSNNLTNVRTPRLGKLLFRPQTWATMNTVQRTWKELK